MSGAGGDATVSSIEEAQTVYEQLISGNGFLSEGFTVRKLSVEEILQHQAIKIYKKKGEPTYVQSVSDGIWKLKNQWDGDSIFLVDSTFHKLVQFTCDCYSKNTVPK